MYGVGVGCSDLRVQCWNINSMMKSRQSWVRIINKVKNSKENIFILVDTRFENEQENEFKKLWDGTVFYNSMSTSQRGIMVLIKDSFAGKNLKFCNILKGDYSRLTFTLCGFEVLIKCCYAPNMDMASFDSESQGYSDTFFKKLFDDSKDSEFDLVIMAGDFNVAPDHNLDTMGYLHINNPNTRFFINRMKSLNMLTDVFRHQHPDTRKYSFNKKQTRNYTRARLDYFLINNDSLDLVSKVGIERVNSLSDHSPIFLHFNLSKIKKGRGFWRLNSDFLKEPEFVFGMNNTLERVIKQYSSNNLEPPGTQEPTLIPLMIPHTLLHDVMLMESRSFALKYAAEQKRKMLQTLTDLGKRIDEKADSNNEEDIEEVNFLKQEIQNMQDERDMAAARKRFEKMQLEGEKPTRFFCQMNKKMGAKAQFEVLHVEEKDKDGNDIVRVVQEQKEIELEVRKFYYKLYSKKEAKVDKLEILQSIEEVTEISDVDRCRLECGITEGEVAVTLMQTRNNVAPGPGGFGGGYYKMFWRYLKSVVIGAINEIYQNRELPLSQRLGIIALIPKGDKDPRFIKNWRPLTLLETFYKLISATLANRLKPVLDNIIGRHQRAYVPGRYIAECTRNTYDLFHYAKSNNLPGMMLLIDFEKAFDSVDFGFLVATLEMFGFGDYFVDWIKIILGCNKGTNFKGVTVVNGNISPSFDIQRGCRQGDPISGYLFILVMEILALLLKKNKNIKPYRTKFGLEHFIDMYADDLSVYLNFRKKNNFLNKQNVCNVLLTMKKFEEWSGLKINLGKTNVTIFGKKVEKPTFVDDLKIKWCVDFKLLGIQFDCTLSNMSVNYDMALDAIRSEINSWKYRFLTIYGKITVIKNLSSDSTEFKCAILGFGTTATM